jgi:hypothetical protein
MQEMIILFLNKAMELLNLRHKILNKVLTIHLLVKLSSLAIRQTLNQVTKPSTHLDLIRGLRTPLLLFPDLIQLLFLLAKEPLHLLLDKPVKLNAKRQTRCLSFNFSTMLLGNSDEIVTCYTY